MVRALITFFAIIDPIGNLLVFQALTRDMRPRDRRLVALVAVGFAFGVLLVFTLGGKSILSYLRISSQSFRIAAGVLLIFPAIRLVERGHPMETREEKTTSSPFTVAFVPLGVPLIAGPGAMATAILFRSSAGLGITLAAVGAILTLSALAFVAATFLLRLMGEATVEIMARIVGIILTALAIEFIVEGLSQIF